jgi:hypothetical protein
MHANQSSTSSPTPTVTHPQLILGSSVMRKLSSVGYWARCLPTASTTNRGRASSTCCFQSRLVSPLTLAAATRRLHKQRRSSTYITQAEHLANLVFEAHDGERFESS